MRPGFVPQLWWLLPVRGAWWWVLGVLRGLGTQERVGCAPVVKGRGEEEEGDLWLTERWGRWRGSWRPGRGEFCVLSVFCLCSDLMPVFLSLSVFLRLDLLRCSSQGDGC